MMNAKIIEVDTKKATQIIETMQPIGLFYCYDRKLVIGIDNSTGESWTEEFKDLESCIDWLNGGELSDR